MTQKNLRKKSSQRGFTLVELAIVLVIIGLIVGGVLTGQTLIEVAKVRAQMTQLDQLDAALNAFRAKYDCLAGDCNAASGVVGAAGDGNGLIDFNGGTWSATLEAALTPNQLATAGLITGSYTPAAGFTAAQIPTGKLAGQIMFGSDASYNYYLIGSYAAGTPITNTFVFPIDAAKAIDVKRDDGLPDTGAVRATSPTGFFTGAVAATGATACTIASGPPNIYNVGAGTTGCILRIRSAG